jgi:hypothetical protein
LIGGVVTIPLAPTVEIGYVSQTYNSAQWWAYDGETTPELMWPQSVEVYDAMRRTDAQVGSVLEAVIRPVLRTPWRIDPAGARMEVVEHVADDLGLPIVGHNPEPPLRTKDRFSWLEHLELALLMLPFGHSFFEQTYRVNHDGTRAHLGKLSPRMPRTIEKIDVARDGGLVSITQWGTLDQRGPQRPIPVNRLVAYVYKREGANWLGRSILRQAYKNWLIKDRLLRVQAQTIERNGMGIPLYEDAEGATAEQHAIGLAMAKAWRAGEAAGSAIPFGSKLRLVGVEGELPDALPAIKYHDEQIARAVLAHFLNLDSQSHGSYALGTSFMDFFTLSLQTLAQSIADVASMHIVEDLVDVNWGSEEPAPRICFDEIGSRQAATAESLKSLVDAGVIRPDEVLEGQARQYYGLPPADPKTVRTPPTAQGPTPPADTPMGALSVAASAEVERLGEDVDDEAEQVLAALDEWVDGQAVKVAAMFDPAQVRAPRGGPGGGRWTKGGGIGGKIADALEQWGRGAAGHVDPFTVDGKEIDREPLRKAAVARGISLKRGAPREDIVKALLDHAKAESATRPAEHLKALRDVQVENNISSAYARITARREAPAHPDLKQYVLLADLRKEMGAGHDRAEVDAALNRMIERPDVYLRAELNQKSLTEADRKAAVVIGGEPRDVLHIGDPSPRPLPKTHQTGTGGRITEEEAWRRTHGDKPMPATKAAKKAANPDGLTAVKGAELHALATANGVKTDGRSDAQIRASLRRKKSIVRAAAGHDVTPGHDELHHYWTRGEGRAKWVDSPKPWTTLVALLTEHVGPDKAKVFASRWFIEVKGYAAGSDKNRVAHGKPPRGKVVGPG